jgi:hypothetical protein
MLTALVIVLQVVGWVGAQTYQRLGTCPTLGCIFPPDQADFLAGQAFDIRLEVHAPVNGSEAYNNGVPDERFTFTIEHEGDEADPRSASEFFGIRETPLEKWNFTWYEDLFASDADVSLCVWTLNRL